MTTTKVIARLREMQSQIITGKNTFGEMADCIENLSVIAARQHKMLRAFRHSMDSNLPFPSRDKLDAIIADGAITYLP